MTSGNQQPPHTLHYYNNRWRCKKTPCAHSAHSCQGDSPCGLSGGHVSGCSSEDTTDGFRTFCHLANSNRIWLSSLSYKQNRELGRRGNGNSSPETAHASPTSRSRRADRRDAQPHSKGRQAKSSSFPKTPASARL